MYRGVFSEFELDRFNIRFDTEAGKGIPQAMNCIGTLEEELTVKKITKNCRGRVERTMTRGTGNGTLKISAHVPYEIYTHLYGMDTENFAEAVMAYGGSSRHPEGVVTCRIKDEDNEVKYKAYPRVVCASAKAAKIENGGEEVSEIELEFDLLPDENDMAMYEALDKNLDNGIASKWMDEFSPELIKKSGQIERAEADL